MNEQTAEQQAVVEMVRDFAATAMAPHTAAWDEENTSPSMCWPRPAPWAWAASMWGGVWRIRAEPGGCLVDL
ncbi:acyl-CoA dehydrogenase family protein [Arthrobacter alpinus]|nr:acyl-CoA dehydrogenase family protein [Arthrobacter alpinus]